MNAIAAALPKPLSARAREAAAPENVNRFTPQLLAARRFFVSVLLSLRDHNANLDASRNPLGELDRLNRRPANLVDSWSRLPELLNGRSSPLADIEETDDAYLVEIEPPGVDRDDIDIEIAGRELFVDAQRKERPRVGILLRRERTVGEFTCQVLLPGAVRDDAIGATMDAGVFTLRVPKPEHEERRRITIQRNRSADAPWDSYRRYLMPRMVNQHGDDGPLPGMRGGICARPVAR